MASLVAAIPLLLVNIYSWYDVSHRPFGEYLKPGDSYVLFDKIHYIPDLKLYKSVPSIQILKKKFMEDMLTLLNNVIQYFKYINVTCWLAGGTLLGHVRHDKSIIPWDDDIDIHTDVKYKNMFFEGKQFTQDAKQFGLELFILKGNSALRCTKEGGAIRLRPIGRKTPVCDVFFVHVKDHTASKIDTWRNTDQYTYNSSEIFPVSAVFPIQEVKTGHDYLPTVPIPADPSTLLHMQYGSMVMTTMVPRSKWFSHEYPYKMTSYAFRRL